MGQPAAIAPMSGTPTPPEARLRVYWTKVSRIFQRKQRRGLNRMALARYYLYPSLDSRNRLGVRLQAQSEAETYSLTAVQRSALAARPNFTHISAKCGRAIEYP
jgi:hypothetical protein